MRTRLLLLLVVLVSVAVIPAYGQGTAKAPFKVEFDPESGVEREKNASGKGLTITVKFFIVRVAGAGNESGKNYKVVIKEHTTEVARLDVPEPKIVDKLSAVLAIDISGSKDRKTGDNNADRRINQSKQAARVFLEKLPGKADCGLILFDHEIKKGDTVAPTENRNRLYSLIDSMKKRGGTAYLDAAKEAIDMLAKTGSDRKKVCVLMTDGIDVRSKAKLAEVIKLAKKEKVNIYTVGLGQPGQREDVTSVLVLDRSASMEEPADATDTTSKIVALRGAAAKFVSVLPPKASTTVLPFGSTLGTAKDFTKTEQDKEALKKDIEAIKTEGETKMLDAAYEAVCMLEAAKRPGKSAVVVMTDGIDNVSRLRPDDVIAKARAAGVTVHMLLFGKEEELQQAIPDMQRIAKETGGTFNHAKNADALKKIFEDMSVVLHDDGIDEVSLKKLARDTGGDYYPAHDINKLQFVTEQISQDLAREPKIVTFESPYGYDGSIHPITVSLVKLNTKEVVVVEVDEHGKKVERTKTVTTEDVVDSTTAKMAVRGVVLAEMHPIIYLGLLGLLVSMAVVPAAVGRMFFRSSV
jgi:Mg-chelatase subunit ChlD